MKKMAGQFIRYVIVGLVSNGVGYLLYLGITAAGVEPKLAVTLLYSLGVAQTFFFNKRWSFEHRGFHGQTLMRYCLAYGLGYLINLSMLYVLVTRYGLPHQLVQGVAVVVVATLLFVSLRFWVFVPNSTRVPEVPLR